MAKDFNIQDFINSISRVDLQELIRKFSNQIQVYTSLSNFPLTGAENALYIDTSTNYIYRWDDTDVKYYSVGGSGGGDISDISVIDGSF